jgi:ubiquinone/menaquinone biosynthesis C-methylase UbiE
VRLYDEFARYYDADVAHYTDDFAFYREMAERSGDPILDAMCGTGRTLLPLAEAGHTLTGLDISGPMLDVAREKLAAAGLEERVTLLHGDIRSTELPAEHFMLAFVAVNSFMHLERVKDQLAALTTLRRSLVSGGVLLLDLFNPDAQRLAQEDNRLEFERLFWLDGQRVHKFVASESDIAAQTSHLTYFYDMLDDTGHMLRHTAQFALRWFYRYELEHLLARAGFRLVSIYGSYDLEEYSASSERLIVLATPRRDPADTQA